MHLNSMNINVYLTQGQVSSCHSAAGHLPVTVRLNFRGFQLLKRNLGGGPFATMLPLFHVGLTA